MNSANMGMQIKAMSETDLAAWWAKYIKQLAVLLATADGNAELAPDVTARIQTLQREALFLHVRYRPLRCIVLSCCYEAGHNCSVPMSIHANLYVHH